MASRKIALKVDHVGMKFNMSKEKVDNLKEYDFGDFEGKTAKVREKVHF